MNVLGTTLSNIGPQDGSQNKGIFSRAEPRLLDKYHGDTYKPSRPVVLHEALPRYHDLTLADEVAQNTVGRVRLPGDHQSSEALHDTSPELTPEPIA